VINACKEWSRELPHTSTTFYYSPQTQLAVMGKLSSFFTLVDGPRPRAGRSALSVAATFHLKSVSELLEEQCADGPPTLAGWSVT
jgi:hypothetical protein